MLLVHPGPNDVSLSIPNQYNYKIGQIYENNFGVKFSKDKYEDLDENEDCITIGIRITSDGSLVCHHTKLDFIRG